jgi:hypothetical protein
MVLVGILFLPETNPGLNTKPVLETNQPETNMAANMARRAARINRRNTPRKQRAHEKIRPSDSTAHPCSSALLADGTQSGPVVMRRNETLDPRMELN